MVDTYIQLGSFTFRDLEIPQSIALGGGQKLVVHELIGGNRVVDVLGAQPGDITWTGIMTGPDALSRAQTLDQMRIAGLPINFSLFNKNYNVIIETFTYEVERFYQVNYTILLKVVIDYSATNTSQGSLNITDQVNLDLTNTITVASILNDSTLNTILFDTQSLMNNTPSLESASPIILKSTVDDYQAASDQLTTLQTDLSKLI